MNSEHDIGPCQASSEVEKLQVTEKVKKVNWKSKNTISFELTDVTNRWQVGNLIGSVVKMLQRWDIGFALTKESLWLVVSEQICYIQGKA